MNEMLKTGLCSECVRLELKARNRDEAIRELIDLINSKHKLKNVSEALDVVMKREAKMSTSLENGIAVPHGKTDTVDSLLVAVGIKQSGIDFFSADGQPSKIIILILSPAAKAGPHVRCLAEIARLLQSETNRKRILAAKTPEEVYQIMIEP